MNIKRYTFDALLLTGFACFYAGVLVMALAIHYVLTRGGCR